MVEKVFLEHHMTLNSKKRIDECFSIKKNYAVQLLLKLFCEIGSFDSATQLPQRKLFKVPI